MTVNKTQALSFAHPLIFRAGKETSVALGSRVMRGQRSWRGNQPQPPHALTSLVPQAVGGFSTVIKYSCGTTCLVCFDWICALKFWLKIPLHGAFSPTTATASCWVLPTGPAAGDSPGRGVSQHLVGFGGALRHPQQQETLPPFFLFSS